MDYLTSLWVICNDVQSLWAAMQLFHNFCNRFLVFIENLLIVLVEIILTEAILVALHHHENDFFVWQWALKEVLYVALNLDLLFRFLYFNMRTSAQNIRFKLTALVDNGLKGCTVGDRVSDVYTDNRWAPWRIPLLIFFVFIRTITSWRLLKFRICVYTLTVVTFMCFWGKMLFTEDMVNKILRTMPFEVNFHEILAKIFSWNPVPWFLDQVE